MSEKFTAPKTLPEIARQVYQEVAEDSNAFLRREAQILEAEDSSYLGRKLTASIMVSVLQDRFPAQRILAGTFFRYECTRRQLAEKGARVPVMGEGTFQKTAQEVKLLITPSPLIVVSFTPEDPLVRLNRLRIARIDNDDPGVGEIVKELNQKPHMAREVDDVFSFIEGVHGAHLNLMLLEEAESSEPGAPEVPTVVSVVRGEIVRTALLETILDPQGFVDQTLDRLLDYAPSMVNKIRGFTFSTMGSNPNSYQLLASLTAFCLMEETQRRGKRFPTIGNSRIVHTDAEIARVLDSDPDSDLANLMIREFNISILKEIADTNQELFGGLAAYLKPLSELVDQDQGLAYAGAMNGIVHAYTTIKTGLT